MDAYCIVPPFILPRPIIEHTIDMEKQELVSLLQRLSPFYYWPNNGNLGDLLIAEATRQFFRRHGLAYREYDSENPPEETSYNLVYGGGGRFTPHWSGLERFTELLTAPAVQKCVILPHSISGVDAFVRAFDARHTIIARTEATRRYCRELNREAHVEVADDMALQMDLSLLPSSEEACRMLPRSRYENMLKNTRRATASVPGSSRRVTFILRTDREKSTRYASPFTYDLSLALSNSDCRENSLNGAWLRAFADALGECDWVVTDRLHVAVMAHLMGKTVLMLDNDYGKLSGVWHQTLFRCKDVHLLADGELPPDVARAWARLNSPWRICLNRWKHRFCHVLRSAKCFIKEYDK